MPRLLILSLLFLAVSCVNSNGCASRAYVISQQVQEVQETAVEEALTPLD